MYSSAAIVPCLILCMINSISALPKTVDFSDKIHANLSIRSDESRVLPIPGYLEGRNAYRVSVMKDRNRPIFARHFVRGLMAATDQYLRNLSNDDPNGGPEDGITYQIAMHGVTLSFGRPRSLRIAEPEYEVPWAAVYDTFSILFTSIQRLDSDESKFFTQRNGLGVNTIVRILEGSFTGRLDLESIESVD